MDKPKAVDKSEKKPFRMTYAHELLLFGSPEVPLGLCQLYIATPDQLCRLHHGMGALNGVQVRLKTLTEQGFVQRGLIPTEKGRSPYYYTPNRRGIRYAARKGVDVQEAFRMSKEVDGQFLFVKHTVELNDMLIAAATLKRPDPNYWLEDFMHERVLKRHPYTALWQGRSFSLIPDAFLDFRVALLSGRQLRWPILLEHDRGTEEQRQFRRRIRAYIIMLRTQGYRQWFEAKGVRVAFSTFTGFDRLKRMREWTRQELASTNDSKAMGKLFVFANFTKPLDPRRIWLNPCWYTIDDSHPIQFLNNQHQRSVETLTTSYSYSCDRNS